MIKIERVPSQRRGDIREADMKCKVVYSLSHNGAPPYVKREMRANALDIAVASNCTLSVENAPRRN